MKELEENEDECVETIVFNIIRLHEALYQSRSIEINEIKKWNKQVSGISVLFNSEPSFDKLNAFAVLISLITCKWCSETV